MFNRDRIERDKARLAKNQDERRKNLLALNSIAVPRNQVNFTKEPRREAYLEGIKLIDIRPQKVEGFPQIIKKNLRGEVSVEMDVQREPEEERV